MENDGATLLKAVPVFRTGAYSGKGSYDLDHLDTLVNTYDPKYRPAPLTVDHAQEGPAYGWVDRIYREGDTLFADLSDVNPSIAEALKSKAYRNRSIEFYSTLVDEGRPGPYFKALTLLGACAPAVHSLPDVQFNTAIPFECFEFEDFEPETVDFQKDETMNEIEMMKAELETFKRAAEEEKAKSEAAKAELEAIRTEKFALQESTRFEKAFDEAFTAGKVLKPELEALRAVYNSLPVSQVVSFDAKSMDVRELFLQTFALRQPQINLETKPLPVKSVAVNPQEAVEAFAEEHNIDYATALKRMI